MKKSAAVAETGLYRQGDVLVQRINATDVPAKAEEIPRDGGRVVLAYGEVTNHAHAIRNRNVLEIEPRDGGAS